MTKLELNNKSNRLLLNQWKWESLAISSSVTITVFFTNLILIAAFSSGSVLILDSSTAEWISHRTSSGSNLISISVTTWCLIVATSRGLAVDLDATPISSANVSSCILMKCSIRGRLWGGGGIAKYKCNLILI